MGDEDTPVGSSWAHFTWLGNFLLSKFTFLRRKLAACFSSCFWSQYADLWSKLNQQGARAQDFSLQEKDEDGDTAQALAWPEGKRQQWQGRCDVMGGAGWGDCAQRWAQGLCWAVGRCNLSMVRGCTILKLHALALLETLWESSA